MRRIAGIGCVVFSLGVQGCLFDHVVVDETKTLDDGQSFSWPLEAGHYRVEMTATGDGAAVDWVGTPCEGTDALQQTGAWTQVCQLAEPGQVVVTNPTVLGTGDATNVVVKVTKLAR